MTQGEQPIAALMVGKMGIKTVSLGDEPIWERPGGYVYLQLDTEEGA